MIQCHRVRAIGISIDAFFDGILSEPVKLAVVGCGCSVATILIAEISDQWNIHRYVNNARHQHLHHN